MVYGELGLWRVFFFFSLSLSLYIYIARRWPSGVPGWVAVIYFYFIFERTWLQEKKKKEKNCPAVLSGARRSSPRPLAGRFFFFERTSRIALCARCASRGKPKMRARRSGKKTRKVSLLGELAWKSEKKTLSQKFGLCMGVPGPSLFLSPSQVGKLVLGRLLPKNTTNCYIYYMRWLTVICTSAGRSRLYWVLTWLRSCFIWTK